jgi:hypothetical protein
LRLLNNTVMRRTFESKCEDVTGGWMKLHNELLNYLSLPNIIRMHEINEDEIGEACSSHTRD